MNAAAQRGELQKLKRLVERGQDVNQRDGYGTTPLMEAAWMGHTECMEYLLQNGAEVDVSTAAIIGDLEGVRRAVEAGHDVNQMDGYDRTPLIWAAIHGQIDCVEWLLQNGAQVDLGEDDDEQYTAMHYAAKGGHLQMMKTLVKAGQNINMWSLDDTPLMLAAHNGHTDCVEWLLKNGAQDNRFGPTALEVALSSPGQFVMDFEAKDILL